VSDECARLFETLCLERLRHVASENDRGGKRLGNSHLVTAAARAERCKFTRAWLDANQPRRDKRGGLLAPPRCG